MIELEILAVIIVCSIAIGIATLVMNKTNYDGEVDDLEQIEYLSEYRKRKKK